MATGHVRKRETKDGKPSYQVIVEGERDPLTGKRERRYKTIQGTKKQAEATLRKMITDLETGSLSTPSSMKVKDWMDRWLGTYLPNIEETTRTGYKEKIETYIKPTLGNIPLKALKADNIQAWVNDLSKGKGLSPKTTRNAYNNLNAALKKAVVLRMIPHNPCEGVELPKREHHEMKVYDRSEIQEALNKAKEDNTEMYLIVLLGALVGLRRGEMVALRWENVDLTERTIFICENRVHGEKEVITKAPKSAAGTRTIAVGDEVIAALSAAKLDFFNARESFSKSNREADYVLHNPDGSPYHPDSITKKWERFVERHGLPPIRLHDLRHSNATALIQAGVSPKVVQQRLGHSDVNITLNTYTHVLPKMDEDAAAKLDGIIFQKASSE